MVMLMTSSFFPLKSKLGFVSLVVFASLLASPMVEAREAETPTLKHKMFENTSSPKEVLLFDVHVYYVAPADLMAKQLDLGHGKDLDEKESANPAISLKMSRKEFKENRRLAAEANKRMKISGDYGNNRDEENLF